MKKITLLMMFLIASITIGYGQFIRLNQYPSQTIVSDNLGFDQVITLGAFSTEYSKLSNLIVGLDYQFSCTTDDVNKYITVPDWENNVIIHGPSPLTVTAITSSDILLHYSDDADCSSGFTSNTVTLKALLTCPPPSIINVTSLTTNSATITWTPQGTETSWQTLVLENGSPAPTVSTIGETATATSLITTTLTAGTSYQFYVRSNCGTEFSPWNGPENFTTSCLAVSSFSESFETTAIDELPLCWSSILNGVGLSPNASIGVQENASVSGTKSIALQNNFSEPTANIILVSPNLNNVGAGTHRIKFFAESWDIATLQIGTLNSLGNDGYFNLISEIQTTSVNNEYIVDFSGYTGTDGFIALKNASDISFSSIFIDDIRWELAPLCDDVTNITINEVTPNTGNITWTPNGGETEWNIVYGSPTDSDPNLLLSTIQTLTTTPTATILGLSENTTYNVWVRSVCGGVDGIGAWIGPKTLSTTCAGVATLQENFDTTLEGSLPTCWTSIVEGAAGFSGVYIYGYGGHSGSNSMQLNNGNSNSDARIMLVSPKLSTLPTGTHRLKFFSYGNAVPLLVEVGTINNPNNSGYFTTYETITLTGSYQEYTVDFSGYLGTDTFIAFKHTGSDIYTSIFIDDVRWEMTPLCDDETNLAGSEVTTSSATISWIVNGSETAWDVVYGESSITDPNTLTPITPNVSLNPTTSLSGLTENTSYNVWVRSACGGTDGNGAWIGPLTIQTACNATDLVNENFETTLFEELPDCFSSFISGPSVDLFASVYAVEFNGNSGNNAVQIYNGTSSSTNDYVALVLPNLSTLSTATHRLKFYAKTNFGPGAISIGTLDGTTDTSVFTMFAERTIDENYTEIIVEFTTYVGTDQLVAIRNTSGEYVSVFIDDVRWELAPLFADVIDIEASDITTTSATINWTQQGSETQWDVVFGSIDITDPSTLTPIVPAPMNTPTKTITGLTANTDYNVWVRSVCGGTDGNGAWMGPIIFTTKCYATEVPYTQNFETANVPNLPSCSGVENINNGKVWNTATILDYGFNSKVLQYEYTCQNAADTWYYTQGINLVGGTTYKISYKYGSNSTLFMEKMKVAYGTSAGFDGMTQELANHDMINFNVALTNEVTFTPTSSDTYYFGFNAYSDACQYYLYVDDIVIDTNLSTPGLSAEKATIYPNPVKDVLNISHTGNITNVSVFNLLGQKVLNKNFNESKVQINLSDLTIGTYLVKTTINNQIITSKIVKE